MSLSYEEALRRWAERRMVELNLPTERVDWSTLKLDTEWQEGGPISDYTWESSWAEMFVSYRLTGGRAVKRITIKQSFEPISGDEIAGFIRDLIAIGHED